MYIMHRKWASTATIFGKTVITQPNPTSLAVDLARLTMSLSSFRDAWSVCVCAFLDQWRLATNCGQWDVLVN